MNFSISSPIPSYRLTKKKNYIHNSEYNYGFLATPIRGLRKIVIVDNCDDLHTYRIPQRWALHWFISVSCSLSLFCRYHCSCDRRWELFCVILLEFVEVFRLALFGFVGSLFFICSRLCCDLVTVCMVCNQLIALFICHLRSIIYLGWFYLSTKKKLWIYKVVPYTHYCVRNISRIKRYTNFFFFKEAHKLFLF